MTTNQRVLWFLIAGSILVGCDNAKMASQNAEQTLASTAKNRPSVAAQISNDEPGSSDDDVTTLPAPAPQPTPRPNLPPPPPQTAADCYKIGDQWDRIRCLSDVADRTAAALPKDPAYGPKCNIDESINVCTLSSDQWPAYFHGEDQDCARRYSGTIRHLKFACSLFVGGLSPRVSEDQFNQPIVAGSEVLAHVVGFQTAVNGQKVNVSCQGPQTSFDTKVQVLKSPGYGITGQFVHLKPENIPVEGDYSCLFSLDESDPYAYEDGRKNAVETIIKIVRNNDTRPGVYNAVRGSGDNLQHPLSYLPLSNVTLNILGRNFKAGMRLVLMDSYGERYLEIPVDASEIKSSSRIVKTINLAATINGKALNDFTPLPGTSPTLAGGPTIYKVIGLDANESVVGTGLDYSAQFRAGPIFVGLPRN